MYKRQVATSFPLLVAMRVAAGLVAGGVFPVAMALTGDLVPVNQRQVAIGRLLAVGLTGNLVGSSIAGVIGDLLGWRGVFAILGSFGLIVTIAAFFAFRGVVTPPPARFNRAAVMVNFRSIFADPRAKVCFTPCSSKQSSSTGSSLTWPSCCLRSGSLVPRSRDC